MRYGYLLITADERDTEAHKDREAALHADRVFWDYSDCKGSDRPSRLDLLERLNAGDTIVVESFDQLFTDWKDLGKTAHQIAEKKAVVEVMQG